MHVIGIRDSVRIAKNKNGKWWKVIGLIPSLPHLGGGRNDFNFKS